MKGKMTGAAALTGFVILAAVGAHAQGFYNYAVPGGLDEFRRRAIRTELRQL